MSQREVAGGCPARITRGLGSMESHGLGETVPDYILSPDPNLNIKGNPLTVASDTRLSTLVSNAPGNHDWAACRSHVDPSIHQP
ncbi:putative adhesin [Schaalia sp. 19OD2882]|uniref:putative adhesin n=1 Tax=Schaalia sp. 19OD2882 TaxID=2794089 RepID=UPI0034665C35